MAENVIVVRAFAGVNEVEMIFVHHPVLLGVVVAQIAAVSPIPAFEFAEMQAVIAGTHVACGVVAQGQIEFPRAADQ